MRKFSREKIFFLCWREIECSESDVQRKRMKTLNPCKKDIACLSIFWYIDYGRIEGYKPFISINPRWRAKWSAKLLWKSFANTIHVRTVHNIWQAFLNRKKDQQFVFNI